MASSGGVVDDLLRRRIVIVGGKGGTGRSTVAAALALLGARAGKRVLAVDVDAKGALAACLGAGPVGFEARSVQTNVSVLELHAEESLQEYLRVFLKVPRFTRLTPLARVFDFIATGVPGPRDMLVAGKVVYEERRRDDRGRPAWDLVVVDGSASGHLVGHLAAARSMHGMMQGGMIRQQAGWIDDTLSDPNRTALCICALAEEMPAVEAVELANAVRTRTGVTLAACVLNRSFPVAITARMVETAEHLADSDRAEQVTALLGGPPGPLLEAARLGRRLHEHSQEYAKRLRAELGVPVVVVPLLVEARPGSGVSRAVAQAMMGGH